MAAASGQELPEKMQSTSVGAAVKLQTTAPASYWLVLFRKTHRSIVGDESVQNRPAAP
jgi:hypothetical protein